MKKFWRLVGREFKLFASNRVASLIFIGAPILYALLIGAVYKDASVKELPVIVVDLDNTPLSNKFIDAIDDNQYLHVVKTQYETGNLRDEMVRNNYVAVVTFPDRFEADIQQKRHPEIDVDINGANMLTANYASTGMQTVLGVLNAGIEIETLKKKGMPTPVAEEQFEAFKINQTRFFNPSSNYLLFLWPGILGTVLQTVFLLALALSFAKEYEDDTFRDLIRYSKRPSFLLLTKSIPYWLMGTALWFPLIRGFFPLFHVGLVQSVGAYILVSALFILCITFMGIAVSIIMDTQLKATEVLMIVATPSFIISGQTWPLASMPSYVRVLADMIPLTHYLEAFRKLILCNATLSDILPQVYALLALLVLCYITAYFSLKYRIARAKI